ncbi:MAG: aspartate aminotransferase family protein [Chloroherpetonaceae bacterium]|nr:aspartate aminotransferase family protein [Chthonomonadaceae bacterium]MDW8206682.1 aspartate aminotransferase family protein [Chloroherpetonaceae bacterium]
MITDEQILDLNAAGILAEVVGYETDEVAQTTFGTSVLTYRGAELIDFTGGIAVHACGHNHPEVVEAIARQARQVLHVSDTMRHRPQLELGQWLRHLLGRIAPGTPWTLLFKNSGSESIDAAAKLALKVTGRKHLIAFEGAFHGRTMLATALSRSKTLHWAAYEPFLEPLRAHIHHAPAPRCQQCALHKRASCCVDGLEQLLERYAGDVAAVFVEPQQGEGGYFPLTPEAGQRIRALTERHGALLIVDEIQTGFGRTGRWFGFQHLNIAPDVIVFGKAVGGGMPLAGLAARQETMSQWEPGEHGTTFGGNPVACAAGLAALKIIEQEGLVERAACLGEAIRTRLRPLIGQYGVAEVRGNGLMIAVELRDASGLPDYRRCEAVKVNARNRGLLLLSCGAKIGNPATDNAAIRLIPPLNTPEDVVYRALDILEAALRETP